MTTKFIGIKEFRQNMAQIYKSALKKKQRLILLKNNKPIFELKPLSQEEEFTNTFIEGIEEALDDVKHGRVYTTEEVNKMLEL